jgi:hypothetical protein
MKPAASALAEDIEACRAALLQPALGAREQRRQRELAARLFRLCLQWHWCTRGAPDGPSQACAAFR